jgi:putative peptidoglycan lipid II flippase
VALHFFGLALLPFTIFQLLTRAFYAQADTRTPMLANVAVNLVNVAGGLLAFGLLERPQARIAGLVVAWGASYVTGVALLSWVLAGRMRAALTSSGRALATAVLASAVMAAVLLGAAAAWTPPAGVVPSTVRTLVLVAIGLSAYLVMALLLGSRELAHLRARLRW